MFSQKIRKVISVEKFYLDDVFRSIKSTFT